MHHPQADAVDPRHVTDAPLGDPLEAATQLESGRRRCRSSTSMPRRDEEREQRSRRARPRNGPALPSLGHERRAAPRRRAGAKMTTSRNGNRSSRHPRHEQEREHDDDAEEEDGRVVAHVTGLEPAQHLRRPGDEAPGPVEEPVDDACGRPRRRRTSANALPGSTTVRP